MSGEFNINIVAAEVINQQLAEVRSALTGAVFRLWATHVSGFRNYVVAMQDRVSKTKTILYKDKAVPLTDLYVGTLLDGPAGSPVSDSDIVELVLSHKHVCVMATAGAGKSFFAKSLFLALLNSRKTIPILLEMRELNNTEGGIVKRLCSDLSGKGYSLSTDELESLLSSGRFSLILDGFDELAPSQYIDASHELIHILRVCQDKCSVVLLSRPDDRVSSIPDFDCYEIRALTKDQAVSLVQKLEYDPSTKDEFISKLRGNLYRQHEDFLSNPLLLTIMLMTYADTAEIPTKIHIFYEQAFDVLFYKHDASKGVYRRDVKSGLPFDDFKALLSAVATSGYIRGKISASREEIIKFIRKGRVISRVPHVVPELFLENLLRTVCILIQDGVNFVYNHRSFQEYFAALFLISSASGSRKEIHDAYLEKDGQSNAFSLAYDMNSNLVEAEYLLPELQRMLVEIGDCPFKALSIWGGTVRIVAVGQEETSDSLTFLIGKGTNCFRLMQFVFRKSGKSLPRRRGIDKREVANVVQHLNSLGGEPDERYNSIDPLEESNHDLLRKVGLCCIVERQIRVCREFASKIAKRSEKSIGKELTEWL